MEPEVHRRYLEYRERHEYFGRMEKLLPAPEFVALDAEHLALEAKGEARDDEDEARFEEVAKRLFRD